MNWDMIGSFADWFAAIGTISAVFSALWIAGAERRRRRDDDRAARIAFASYAVCELAHVATLVGEIRGLIRKSQAEGVIRRGDLQEIEAIAFALDLPLSRGNIGSAGLFSMEVARAVSMAVAGLDQNKRIVVMLANAQPRDTINRDEARDVELYRFRFLDTQIWINRAIQGLSSEAGIPVPPDGGNWNLSHEDTEYWHKNR